MLRKEEVTVSEMHLALAEELERIAAGYRSLATAKTDEIDIQDIRIVLNNKMSKGKSIPQYLYDVNFYLYEVTYFIATQLVLPVGFEPTLYWV